MNGSGVEVRLNFAEAVAVGVHKAVDDLVHNPEEQAAFAGGVAAPVMLTLMARGRLPFPVFLLASLGGQQLGRMAYRARRDLADIADAARANRQAADAAKS